MNSWFLTYIQIDKHRNRYGGVGGAGDVTHTDTYISEFSPPRELETANIRHAIVQILVSKYISQELVIIEELADSRAGTGK